MNHGGIEIRFNCYRMVNGELKIGFFAPRSHEIIDMETCLIQDEIADKVVGITRSWIKKK